MLRERGHLTVFSGIGDKLHAQLNFSLVPSPSFHSLLRWCSKGLGGSRSFFSPKVQVIVWDFFANLNTKLSPKIRELLHSITLKVTDDRMSWGIHVSTDYPTKDTRKFGD